MKSYRISDKGMKRIEGIIKGQQDEDNYPDGLTPAKMRKPYTAHSVLFIDRDDAIDACVALNDRLGGSPASYRMLDNYFGPGEGVWMVEVSGISFWEFYEILEEVGLYEKALKNH